MLDLDRLKRIRLRRTPPVQILVAETLLRLNYRLPRPTDIVFEGLEHVPRDRRVFFAMNHTDRFNYWPFQYGMYRRKLPFTATWVKGKYYEARALGWFMDATNNIPVPSRGYVISTEFRKLHGRPPGKEEYRVLRDLVDGRGDGASDSEAVRRLLGPDVGGFLARFDALFGEMIGEVIRLNREALFDRDLNVLVFPQGTRSKRLSRGHTGLAQMAQHLGAAIVPVGCSGCDRLYPGSSPLSRGGQVVYRVGAPLEPDGPELAPYRVKQPFTPLTTAASERHGADLRAITDLVMARIDALVDPEYRFGDSTDSDGVRDMERFL